MAIQGKLGEFTWPGHMLCSFCIIGIDITKVEVDVEVLPRFAVFFFFPLSLDPISSSKLDLHRSQICIEDFFNRTKLQWCGNSVVLKNSDNVGQFWKPCFKCWMGDSFEIWVMLHTECKLLPFTLSKQKRVLWLYFAFLHSNHEYCDYLYEFEASVANPNGDLESAHVLGINLSHSGWPFWIVNINIEGRFTSWTMKSEHGRWPFFHGLIW